MDSKRQKIVDLVIARMQLIKAADGYQTNLGESVEDWRVDYSDDDLDAPVLSVCDLIDEHELVNDQPDAAKQINRLPVQLRIFAKSTTRAADLRKCISDVNRAIRIDLRWRDADGKALAMWTRPVRSGMVVKPDEFQIGGAAVEIEIAYMTETFNQEI